MVGKVKISPIVRAVKRLILDYSRQDRRSYSWELEFEEARALFMGDCFYCGAKPSRPFWAKDSSTPRLLMDYNGIDRLDNSIGYTVSNCVSACFICNRGKRNLSIGQLKDWLIALGRSC